MTVKESKTIRNDNHKGISTGLNKKDKIIPAGSYPCDDENFSVLDPYLRGYDDALAEVEKKLKILEDKAIEYNDETTGFYNEDWDEFKKDLQKMKEKNGEKEINN